MATTEASRNQVPDNVGINQWDAQVKDPYCGANPWPSSSTRARLLAAWTSKGARWQIAAIVIMIVALGSILSEDVPVASGAATTVLVGAALVDIHQRRIPNAIVVGAASMFVVVLVVEASTGTQVRMTHIALGALLMGGPLLVLHLLSPAAMGFGDVKAAIVLGAAAGAVDWQLALAALALAAGATATVGVIRRSQTIPFGPGLVAGTAIALAANTLLLAQPASKGEAVAVHDCEQVWGCTT